MSWQNLLILSVPIFTITVAQLCYKKGVLELGELNFSFPNFLNLITRIFQNGWMIGGTVLFGIGFIFYLFILSKYQLNIVYPILVSAGIVSITITSWFLFKESLSWLQILGIIAVIFGVFLLLPKH